MNSRSKVLDSRTRRIATGAIMAVTALALAACTPPPAPTYTNGVCPGDSGVTVVVDFTADLNNQTVVRCALGPQATGIKALQNIGMPVNTNAPNAFPGSVCTIKSLPTQGYPYCWSEGGFWGYWAAADQGSEWGFSPIGAGQGPLTEGSVIGFSWAQGFNSNPPRVAPDGSLPAAG